MDVTWKSILLLVSLALAVGLTTGVVFGALDREFDKPISATVTVKVASSEEAADVNDDGQVDDLDLRIVARSINTSPPRNPRADVDGDGSVNVFDLAFVGFHYAPVQPPPEPVIAALGASKDNTLYQSATGALSNGAGQHFFAGKNNGGLTRRGVVAFNISGSIPAGSTINSVSLILNMSRTISGAQSVSLYRLTADWGEGRSDALGQEGGGAPSAAGDATWVHRFFDTTNWGSQGGDFSGSASASTMVAGIGGYTWGSTSQMVSDVQAWLDNPSSNFGWLLRGNEGVSRTTKRFDTKENGAVDNRPVLTVNYTPPS